MPSAAANEDKPQKTYKNLDDFHRRGLDRARRHGGVHRDWMAPSMLSQKAHATKLAAVNPN
jgi:hypothetical protein